MKIFQLSIFALLFLSFSAIAQPKPTAKAIIKTPGLISDLCKDRVERAIFKQYGIISVKADVKKKITTVSWLTDRTDIEQIKTFIANAGFDADDVTADEDVKKKLPPACRLSAVVTQQKP